MQHPVVETAHGKVRGTAAGGALVFRGLRYGAPTGGSNRFRPPAPVTPWAGVLDTLHNGPSAPQSAVPHNTDPFFSWYSAIEPVSEDCLCMNIFTPAADQGRRPVMVWIHGGGWREYAGTAPGFDGTRLARTQDVVVVSINHRLNAFGFLRLGDGDDRFLESTNAGLLDIVQALEWVRGNIGAFGGSPDNVTIFGESGGGSKIAAMLSMRRAKGLFHKAVVQSSGGGRRLATPDEAASLAAGLARVLGQGRLHGAELQALPMSDLIGAIRSAGGSFRGSIDQRYFDDHPYDGVATSVSADIPVLIGCTNTEATYHLRGHPESFGVDFPEVRRRLAGFMVIDEPHAARIIATYRDAYPHYGPSDILAIIASDYMFKRTNYSIAELQASVATAPVFAYLFSKESLVEEGRTRASHTAEVPFIFGTTAQAEACVGSGPDVLQLEDTMMAIWAAFARSGKPAIPDLSEWPTFSRERRHTMVLDVESHLELDPGGEAMRALDELPFYGYNHKIDWIVYGR